MNSAYHQHGPLESGDPTSGDIFTHFVNEDHGGHGHAGISANSGVPSSHGSVSGQGSLSALSTPQGRGASQRGGSSTTSLTLSGEFEVSPAPIGGDALQTPAPGSKLKTPRSRSSRSRKGRPTSLRLPLGAPTGTAYVNVGRSFPGMTLVYRCPFAHCHRFYATKLALRRHFLSYNHMATTEYIEFDGSGLLTAEEVRRKAISSMPRAFKCPVLNCGETYQDVMAYAGISTKVMRLLASPLLVRDSVRRHPITS
jgi:hypothetical protein